MNRRSIVIGALVAGSWYFGSTQLAYILGYNFWEMRLFRSITLLLMVVGGIFVFGMKGSEKV